MGVIGAFVGATLFFLALLWLSARRAITICVLRVDAGQIVVAEGGITPRILSDLRDVVRHPRVKSARVRITRNRERAAVEANGLTHDQLQRFRNIVGSVPVAKLTNARKVA